MSKPRPRLSLGPEGAKPKTTPADTNSRIAYKERNDHDEGSRQPARGRDDYRSERGRGRPNDGRDSQADFGLGTDNRRGPGSERKSGGYGRDGQRSGGRSDSSPYGRPAGGDGRGPARGDSRGPARDGQRSERGPARGDSRGPARDGQRSERGPARGDSRGPARDSQRNERGPARNDSRGPARDGQRDERGPRSNDPWANARPAAPRDQRDSGDERRPPRAQRHEESSPVRSEGSPWPKARATKYEEPVEAVAEVSEPRGLASDESKIYGLNACSLFFKHHPEAVIRAYFTEATARAKFGPMMKALAASKRAYHVIENDEMEKVTDSQHHEGVCLVIKDLPEQSLNEWLEAQPADASGCLLLLDRIGNPHNLGAIMRAAAHYQVAAIVTENTAALRSGAAMRTSEGGALFVPVLSSGSLVAAILALQEHGYTVFATSSRDSADIYRTKLPTRTAFIMGEEHSGVSEACMEAADKRLLIGGSGLIDSLNVSVASALLASEYWRQHQVVAPAKAAAKSSAKGKSAPAKAKAVKADSAAQTPAPAAAAADAKPAKPAKAIKATAISTDLPEIPPVQVLDHLAVETPTAKPVKAKAVKASATKVAAEAPAAAAPKAKAVKAAATPKVLKPRAVKAKPVADSE